MSLLDVGTACASCALVDFLPFTCEHCARTFCRDHVHSHACVDVPTTAPRKRARGSCAAGCGRETIESIGGLEVGGAGGAGEGIAREVRCRGCGEAFCVVHRAQDAHDCAAPREDTARSDAGVARRAHAQEVLARTMPSQAGKERLTMPKQVDRTRTAPAESGRLPPSVIAQREEEARKAAGVATASTGSASTAPTAPAAQTAPSAEPSQPASGWTDTDAYRKLHKLHCMKIRSLSKPLDRTPREQCRAVEWTVDLAGGRVRAWSPATNFKPDGAAAALGERKPERIWVPESMPGGKLFDTLVSAAKVPRDGEPLSLLCVSLQPGPPRAPAPLDLGAPVGAQLAHGDVLVLVRGWT